MGENFYLKLLEVARSMLHEAEIEKEPQLAIFRLSDTINVLKTMQEIKAAEIPKNAVQGVNLLG